ncbi:hypothetical protein H8S90_00900 [Olivibacter sp. SDN3]|uniref:hypothetical protein n=1 Tax=Olivibacter sp. SDN3 TaxID=2764720 RepID=UPI0016516002|nr:hypothetical protein [Olivibacter sp. SDN3]QNL50224.1 hypothetical protein H8S90_00900 [Olivibacter sp. SDN3]
MSLSRIRSGFWTIFLTIAITPALYAQHASGFMPLNRLGISYQKSMGIDLGFGAYSVLFGHKKASFFDMSLGTEAVFAKQFALVPKLNIDAGVPVWMLGGLTVGGGVDVGWYTDFSTNSLRITPKMGVTAGSVIRLYYGYHAYSRMPLPEGIGRHRISLELNIAAFHDFKIGL